MENNNDFKYILQDTGHIYFGKELTYKEIFDREDVPFKFKAIINSYFSKDVDMDLKMSDHILTIDSTTFSYRIFEQLKLEIRIFYQDISQSKFGHKKEKWIHKKCSLKQFLDNYVHKVQNGEVMIEDMSISKLALMAISI